MGGWENLLKSFLLKSDSKEIIKKMIGSLKLGFDIIILK